MNRSDNGSRNPGQTSGDVVSSLRGKLQTMLSVPCEHCIYRVPERLQHANDKAYNPQVISIGPFHHGKEELKAVEEDKLFYLKSFLARTKEISLESLVEFIGKREQQVRRYYAETFSNISSHDFVEMVVVDAVFVVELLRRNFFRKQIGKDDNIFHKPLKLADIRHDLMLLENQLPFFILEDIFPMMKIDIPPCNQKTALIKITYKFFHAKAYLGKDEQKVLEKTRDSEIKHFIDFFRQCHVPVHRPAKREIQTLSLPSVTALHQAGVKFKGSSGSLLDIKFCEGTLMIPLLRITKSTESFLLNMLAFEQCHLLDYYINDYVFILDRLIDDKSDVELLVKSKVFESKLPDNEEVVTSVNNLVRGSILRRKHFNFKDLCDDLNNHCSNPWNTWKATLKRDYFGTPLTIFAVVAATALFILTFIQTICSCGWPFKKN